MAWTTCLVSAELSDVGNALLISLLSSRVPRFPCTWVLILQQASSSSYETITVPSAAGRQAPDISTFKSIFSRFADVLLAKAVHMAKPVITEGGNSAKVWFQGGRFCSLPLHFTAGGCMHNLFHSLNNLIHFSE